MILTTGEDKLVVDVRADMTNGQAGTDTTLFSRSQTGLITAVGATDLTLNDKTISGSTINVTHIITTSLGNGSTLAEYEVNNGTISYNRVLKNGLAKTSDDQFTFIHNFGFTVTL